MIAANIILDSINSVTGNRLTTFAIHCPRFILAEIITHRSLSRNASSSRAIPAKKIRYQVLHDPVIPVEFGLTGRGMQSHGSLSPLKTWLAKSLWLLARYPVVIFHWLLSDILGLAKQVSNRILEPWMWADVLITGTEWNNFFALRCHKDAQPEFQMVAGLMKSLRENSVPILLKPGDWHLPFVQESDRQTYADIELLKKISAARCARVSYLLPDTNTFSTPERDLELCTRLMTEPLHASPFEPVAQALATKERCANFVGWRQMRQVLEKHNHGNFI